MQYDHNKRKHAIHVLVADNSHFHTQLLVGALSEEADLNVFSSDLDTENISVAVVSKNIDVIVLTLLTDEDTERRFRILRELRGADHHTRPVVLLESSQPESVVEAFRAGARGVFDHRESPEALCQCIRQVHDGRIWINNEQIALVLDSVASTPNLGKSDARGMSLLSKREQEVVSWVTEGLTNREIAERLGLSQHTVKNHLFRIFDKLGVSNRIELLFLTLSHNPEESVSAVGSDLLSNPFTECDDASLVACEKAAEHGVLAAQLVLARTYLAGGARDHNAALAYVWFSIALEQLTRFKNQAKRAMNVAQLAEAERQIRERLTGGKRIERVINTQGSPKLVSSVVA